MTARLRGHGLTLDSVVPLGKVVQLLDVSNLSAGGTGADHTARAHPRWTNLACHITDRMGLRFCGVDIACPDITSNKSPYSILEVNAAPGLDHYAAMGPSQCEVVKNMYRSALNTCP